MTTVATPDASQTAYRANDITITNAVDRWIFVFMAVFFIAITLTGFVPDSIEKLAAVEAGQRAPFPLVMHFHAVLMGTFLLLLLAQTTLAATGNLQYHRRLGVAASIVAPALVVAGFFLVPAIYQQVWGGMQVAPIEARGELQGLLLLLDDIMLAQIRIGILFSIFMFIAYRARLTDPGLHKRMMFLAVAIALPAAFDRMTWLPTTMPGSPLTIELYVLVALAPMFIWDVLRTRTVHKAYWIWLALMVPTSIAMFALWDTDWWHAMAPKIVGVA